MIFYIIIFIAFILFIRIEHKRQKQRIVDILKIDDDEISRKLKMMLGGDVNERD